MEFSAGISQDRAHAADPQAADRIVRAYVLRGGLLVVLSGLAYALAAWHLAAGRETGLDAWVAFADPLLGTIVDFLPIAERAAGWAAQIGGDAMARLVAHVLAMSWLVALAGVVAMRVCTPAAVVAARRSLQRRFASAPRASLCKLAALMSAGVLVFCLGMSEILVFGHYIEEIPDINSRFIAIFISIYSIMTSILFIFIPSSLSLVLPAVLSAVRPAPTAAPR